MKEQLTTLFTQCVNNSQSMRERLQKDAIGTASPTERIITRRFNVSETAELVGVARAAIDQAEKDGRLPPPERNEHGAKLGYTLYQIQQIRELFGTALVQPHAVTMAVASNKGGAYKTSVAVHAAQWFALLGYRVLLIDSDPQGTAGDYFGWSSRWVDGGKTIVPWMLGREQSLAYAIHPTCWPGIDLIPANQELQRIDKEMDKLDLPYPAHLMLRAGIDTIRDNYDLVIIDGAPNLADGTIAQVFAADVLICPTPAEVHDTASTEQFFSLLRDITSAVPDEDVWAIPDVRILVTKLANVSGSSSQKVKDEIHKAWGGMVLANPVRVTEEVGKAQIRMRTVYEQDRSERSSPAAWKNACGMWDALFTEVRETLLKPRWGTAS